MKHKVKYIKIFLFIYIFINVIIILNAIVYFLGVGINSLEEFIINYFPQNNPGITPTKSVSIIPSVSISPQVSPSSVLTKQLLYMDAGKIKQAIIEEEIKITYYEEQVDITDNIEIYQGDDLSIITKIDKYRFFEVGRVNKGKISSEYLTMDNKYIRETKNFLGYRFVLGVNFEEDTSDDNAFIHLFYDKNAISEKYYLLDVKIYETLGEQRANDYFPLEIEKISAFNPLYNYASTKGFVSSKGATIQGYLQTIIKIGEIDNVFEIDDIMGIKIYQGKLKEKLIIFVINPNQFIIELKYRPSINQYDSMDVDDIGLPQITWVNGGQNIYKYFATQRDGVCDTENIDFVEIDLKRFKETGKDKLGNAIFESKYPTTDKEILEMYGKYKEYVTKSNQANPVSTPEPIKTFEQFAATHPMIYWESEFGLFVRLKQARYIDVTECN